MAGYLRKASKHKKLSERYYSPFLTVQAEEYDTHIADTWREERLRIVE